ncbi:MAG: hypothetical protein A3G76_03100 [Acidobacteria bacterium RIFCSPLOWO2_12_FULL_65_11]|nr:MAG: hypothetical protein A3H95_10260 [Acidobacteria bacterium RIFCSPLOWO2_02_FULL_64_15]OFW34266.1 MAG: hypothetical protein A3G76_03100 [Acidobacteria bacterium RIFCSPLOWO2_12_FULL_65_11]
MLIASGKPIAILASVEDDEFEETASPTTAVWLATHRGPVVLVNQATIRIENLYRRLGYDVR